MESFSEADIKARIERDNPWWRGPAYTIPESEWPRRVYFRSFCRLALNFEVQRAAILLGPRRVGKTSMVKQLVQEAIISGVPPKNVLYASIDATIYSGLSLEAFLRYLPDTDQDAGRRVVIFDEIQYRRNWETDLKDLVDNHKGIKFIASGSAAAALKLKSKESGAGRFSDFMLPPLTFYEFLLFLGEAEAHIGSVDADDGWGRYPVLDIERLNSRFIDYLNWGGYPEAVINQQIRANAEQFIKNDIIDKVLLNDLPSLYGIADIQELKRLFAFLAYNAGNEASLENICQGANLTKPTIKRYIDYLKSAFLILKVSNVDDNCRSLKRERTFKVYLNNPSMRAAFFSPLKADDTQKIGQLAECAIFAQWQHSSDFDNFRYARWRNEGEVDIVQLGAATQKPNWIGEIKWSDRIKTNRPDETKGLVALLRKHPSIRNAVFTSRTAEDVLTIEGREVRVVPTAKWCYMLGRNIAAGIERLSAAGEREEKVA